MSERDTLRTLAVADTAGQAVTATVVSLEQRRRRGFYWAFAGVGHVVLSLPDGTEHVLTPKRARLLAQALQTIADTVEAEGANG